MKCPHCNNIMRHIKDFTEYRTYGCKCFPAPANLEYSVDVAVSYSYDLYDAHIYIYRNSDKAEYKIFFDYKSENFEISHLPSMSHIYEGNCSISNLKPTIEKILNNLIFI